MDSIENRLHRKSTFKNNATRKVPIAGYRSYSTFYNGTIRDIAYELSPYSMRQHQLQDLFSGKAQSSLINCSRPCDLKIRCDQYVSCYEHIINGRIVRDYGYY